MLVVESGRAGLAGLRPFVFCDLEAQLGLQS